MTLQQQSIQHLISEISHKLCDKYCNEELCIQYAWWVLESITQKNKTDLLIQETITLSENQQTKLDKWIEQQVKDNVPLQYLIGSVPFVNCSILVEPPILIPRPETEEWCIALIEKLRTISKPLRILDIGTGSGCIAIAIAQALPHAQLWATDISKDALNLAQKNAEINGVNNITFVLSDIFNDIPAHTHFDVIISNPPYISALEWRTLDPSVKVWEDNNALIAPDNGIGILKQIIDTAPYFLNSCPALLEKNIPNLFVEIGYSQGNEVRDLFHNGGFINICIQKDLYGNDRLVSGYINVEKYNAK